MAGTDPKVFVLDASVLVEFVIEGDHREGADALTDRHLDDPDVVLVTASHGFVEVANVLRRLVRAELMSSGEGSVALDWLAGLDLVVDATQPRLPEIWAWRDAMNAYEAAYAAAAAAFDGRLVSVDERLLRACDGVGVPGLHLDDMAAA